MRDHVFRERMIEISRDEEVCRAWDVLAEQDHTYHMCRAWDVLAKQDHTYHMSEEENFHYRQNWWISLKKSGNDTQPATNRSDFKEALSTLNRLH